jgi:hypothetical protein
MSSANPALKRFIPIGQTSGGRLDPDSLANAIQHGFRSVTGHLDPQVPAHD